MKRILCMLFAALLILTACASEEVPKDESSTAKKELPECSDSTDYGEMKLIVFETGKSDSILVMTESHTVIIDTADDDDSGIVTEYLRQKRIKTVDTLVITHFDNDHIGSADTVFETFDVKTVLQPDYESKGAYYEEYVNARDASDADVKTLTGEAYSFKYDQVEFTVYPPQQSSYAGGSNEMSLCVMIKHGNRSFMIAGDIMNERMKEMIAVGDIHADFLKVPHHGVHTSGVKEFLEAVDPYYAAITDSKANPADKRVLEILNSLGAYSYQTENGDVIVESDGKSLTVTQKKMQL